MNDLGILFDVLWALACRRFTHRLDLEETRQTEVYRTLGCPDIYKDVHCAAADHSFFAGFLGGQ